ncbi:unnamed protein product [Calicophoron daubneyi]|uniref:protein O-GlcNAcase n=1 Tax=Calicophoron daubneyi TaxID=300641 RepID=A0AAV2TCL8_CALDB
MTNESKKLPGDNDFLTGVVEGFYGRPWTYPQRKELFRRMNHMGMNAYLYAPKDDIKHRQSWRDLYTPEEEQELKSLITESTDAGVLFIFAISPGLDLIFSSAKEVEILKKKVDQVSKLGCRAFALLFDDIEPRLCPADREVFTSSARAQVVIANEIYDYLGCPNVFLFCPTEYSASLAVPSISKSEYLSTVASYLAPGITVFWTGPLVVSKNIVATDLRDLSKMLRHPIIIWDNLHANDYDQRRVFIGPYSGRPIALRRDNLVRGVLSNPNCEFEANYVALHTLAQWSRHGALKSPSPMLDKEMTEPTTSASGESRGDMYDDAVSDTSNGADGSQKTTNGPTYRPREALLFALRDWLSLMLQDQQVAHPPSSKSSLTVGIPTPMETDALETNDAEMQVESLPTSDPSPNATAAEASNGRASDLNGPVSVTLEDLELFADLFYLPFSHGPAGMRLLELGYWLREHSYARGPNPSDPETSEWLQKFGEFTEMVASITRLRGRIQHLPSRSIAYELAPYISEVHTVLCMLLDYFRWLETGVMANRSMCHLRRLLTWFSPGYKDMVTSGDQEPWTFRGGLITELQRILPLESAQDLFPAPSRAIPGMATVPNLNWTDISNSGGIASAPAPFIPYQPPFSTGRLNRTYAYSVRPYRPEDKQNVYALFRRLLLSRVGLPENALPPELANLPGDRYLLHFLEYSPENCFVVEGPPFLYAATHEDTSRKNGISDKKAVSCIGFGFSAPNAVACARDRTASYQNVLRLRYPRTDVPTPSNNTESDLINPPPSCNASLDKQTQPNKLSSITPMAGSLLPDECTSIGSSPKSSMSVDELIKFLQLPFHVDVPAVAEIAVAADVVPLPEPLGAALPTQPALSGCLEPTDIDNVASAAEVMVAPPSIPMDMPPAPSKCGPSSSAPVLPAPILPDTAPPSPPPTGDVQVPIESCSSSPVVPVTIPSRSVSVAAGPEALHTVLAAHPASVWVEFDDTGVVGCAGLPAASPAPVIPPSPVVTNPNLGLNFDPPELIFDSVARRLFICMLAGLKTIGAHGAHVHLDVINEGRADLYRRFGFYPVPAASTDQTTVLARLI